MNGCSQLQGELGKVDLDTAPGLRVGEAWHTVDDLETSIRGVNTDPKIVGVLL